MNTSGDAPARRIFNADYELAEPAEIEALQLARLRDLLQQVWRTNPFYREHWERAGVDVNAISSLADFRSALPTVEKADFVQDQEQHPPFGRRVSAAVAAGQRMDFFTTSGTSGQGMEVHAQTVREMRRMQEVYGFGLRWSGLQPGDRAALTLPVTMLAGGRVEMQGAEGYGLSVLPVGNYDASRKLDVIRRFRPTALLGSTTYFARLAASCDDAANMGVEVLLTGLEGVGFPYLERLQKAWNATAFDRFGCAQMRSDFMFNCEFGVGSAERPGLLHAIAPWVLVEVIDPETGEHVADGEYGEIVVTSLYHTDTPVVRCRLRDGGVFHDARYCGCGRPFSGVEVCSISRTDDVKKVKGVNIFPQAVDAAVFSVPAVDEYEVLLASAQDSSDVALVTVMPKPDVPVDQHAELCERVAAALRDRVGITFSVSAGAVARSEYKARRWRDERER